jgi:hypothetical protein
MDVPADEIPGCSMAKGNFIVAISKIRAFIRI